MGVLRCRFLVATATMKINAIVKIVTYPHDRPVLRHK
jgi:hypothetical protein